MEKISKFQFIRTDEVQVIIRYYNEDKDRFEKVCTAKQVQLVNDTLLIADGVYRFACNGKLVWLGTEAEAAQIWEDTYGRKLLMFDTNKTPLPCKVMFIVPNAEECILADEYKLFTDGIEVTLFGSKRIEYRLVRIGEQDDDGIPRTYLEKRIL